MVFRPIGASLKRACTSFDELRNILNTEEGQDHYLLAGLVLSATDRGLLLDSNQCYDFTISPILGGKLDIDNVEIQDFVVAVNIAGQIHHQCKDLPPGTPISEITIQEPEY